MVNTGGGMAGGDRARIELAAGPGARVFVTTQAAEKVYRADGAPCRIEMRLGVEAGGALCLGAAGNAAVRRRLARAPARGRRRRGRFAVADRGGRVRPSRAWRRQDRGPIPRPLAGSARRPPRLRRGASAGERGGRSRPARGRARRARDRDAVYAAPGAPDRLADLREAIAAPRPKRPASSTPARAPSTACSSRAPSRARPNWCARRSKRRTASLRGRGRPRVWT